MDYTIDGKCAENCGICCTATLVASDYEIKKIKQYIKRNQIQAVNYNEGATHYQDICPFLNAEDKRCNIYIHRLEICKWFMCNGSKGNLHHQDKHMINMYEEFYPEIKLPEDKPNIKAMDYDYQSKKEKAYGKFNDKL